MTSKTTNKFAPEVRERAVRMAAASCRRFFRRSMPRGSAWPDLGASRSSSFSLAVIGQGKERA